MKTAMECSVFTYCLHCPQAHSTWEIRECTTRKKDNNTVTGSVWFPFSIPIPGVSAQRGPYRHSETHSRCD